MTKRLIVDSTGAVVPATRFVAQRGDNHQSKSPPLQHLAKVLRGEEQPKICIVRDRGGIGDVLMTTPTVRAIKQKYKCLIDYATCPDYLNGSLVKVLATNQDIDNIVDYRTVDKTAYQATVNLSCPCTDHEVPGAVPINRIDLFARGAGLPIPLVDPSLEYTVLEHEKNWAQEWLARRNLDKQKFILIQANSSTQRRDMPQRVLQQGIMKTLKYFRGSVRGVVVLHDKNKTPDINWNLDGVAPLLNHGVREIAALVDQAALVICPDSAILHLASALHKKTVALFGPTDPKARVNYHPEAVAICPGIELHCQPCWYSACYNAYGCWKRISDNMIAEVAVSLLEEQLLKSQREYIHFGGLIEGQSPVISTPGRSFEVL